MQLCLVNGVLNCVHRHRANKFLLYCFNFSLSFQFLPFKLQAEEDGFKITTAVHGKAAVGAGFNLKF